MTAAQAHKTANVKIAKPFMSDEIVKSVEEILRSGFLVQGKFVREFEKRLGEFIGVKHVLAVNSGTAALHVSIFSILENRRKADQIESPEVVTTPLSFAATANAALAAGCRPVFADVDEETFNLDPKLAEEEISEKSIAIEPVDVYGLPAELDEFTSLARKNHLAVVEDAAEAIGASYSGKNVGTISDLTCFSTYATKNLHTGEGGFITTNNDILAESIEMIRSQGQSSRYNHKFLGFNYRMLEMVAAIGIPQVAILGELNARRRDNALLLKERLSKLESLSFQKVVHPESHAWYMFPVLLGENKSHFTRDKLVAQLREKGIEADVSWPTPIHMQPYYKERFGYEEGDFPKAEKICKSIFQLPIQPFLTREDVERTASTLSRLLS